MGVALNQAVDRDKASQLNFVACPTSHPLVGETVRSEIGPYNARHLAGQALSLAESLSPSYMQVYVSSLEDFSSLKALAQPKKR